MKTPATFTDEELAVIEKAIDVAVPAAIVLGGRLEAQHLKTVRQKLWAQRHGTEATDVESV